MDQKIENSLGKGGGPKMNGCPEKVRFLQIALVQSNMSIYSPGMSKHDTHHEMNEIILKSGLMDMLVTTNIAGSS